MFSRLLNKIFPYRLLPDAEYQKYLKALGNNADFIAKNNILEKQVQMLKAKIEELDPYNFSVLANLNDPAPIDKVQRSMYVAQVAGLHKEILEPKIKYMISNIFALLESSTNDREYDQALKGAIYFARELNLWGNAMINEQVAIQTEQNNSSNQDKTIKS